MKETLKKLYKQDFIEEVLHFDFKKYYYYIDDYNHIFGILKNALSENEHKIILSFYDPFTEEESYVENKELYDYLFGVSKEKIALKNVKYYFIKFLSTIDEELNSDLYQLLKESFNQKAYFIKKKNVYIACCDREYDILFLDILKSIESDFLVKLIGFESDLFEVNDLLSTYFIHDFNAFKGYRNTNKLIINKIDLISIQILSQIDNNKKGLIKSYILKEYVNDSEMINIIKMYFETNFNSTLAAKNCYMHRNTFLNKIDKFTQVTHFNLRQYNEAFVVYLAIIM